MGGLTSAVAPILQIGSTLGTVANAAMPFIEDRQSREYKKKQNALALQQAQANAVVQKEQLRLAAVQDETGRRTSLKRAVARQKANFGAKGIGSGDGSSEAVLLGLFEESEQERALREQMENLRSGAIDLSVAQIQQKNLLELARQREKQNLDRLTDIF